MDADRIYNVSRQRKGQLPRGHTEGKWTSHETPLMQKKIAGVWGVSKQCCWGLREKRKERLNGPVSGPSRKMLGAIKVFEHDMPDSSEER